MSESEVTTTMSEPTTAEAFPEAAAILAEAGWKPHDGWNVYTRDTLVMGFQPDGQAFHVKNWAAIQEGHPQWNADTPDTAEEAAAWLVERFKPNPLTTEATLDPVALQSEEVETPKDESNGETGEETDQQAESVEVSRPGWAEGAETERNDYDASARSDDDGSGDVVSTDPIDADFTIEDLGGPEDHADLILEGGDPWSAPELPAPEPEDFAPDEFVEEETGSGAFIFGDNLAHDRIVRIGQLAEYANSLIDAAKVGYSEAEHNAVRSHVVTNMNEAGSYVGGDQALFNRFIELEGVTARVSRIELYRDERQDFIRAADREAVAAFDPAAGWP